MCFYFFSCSNTLSQYYHSSLQCFLPVNWKFLSDLPFGADLLSLADTNIGCRNLVHFQFCCICCFHLAFNEHLLYFPYPYDIGAARIWYVFFFFSLFLLLVWQEWYGTHQNSWVTPRMDFFPTKTSACDGQTWFTHTHIHSDCGFPGLILQKNQSVWHNKILSQSLASGEMSSLLLVPLSTRRMENWQQNCKSTDKWSAQMQLSWWLNLDLGKESRDLI